jgi:hypothetical protein
MTLSSSVRVRDKPMNDRLNLRDAGEQLDPEGRKRGMQRKGSGRSARRSDGRKVIAHRASLRRHAATARGVQRSALRVVPRERGHKRHSRLAKLSAAQTRLAGIRTRTDRITPVALLRALAVMTTHVHRRRLRMTRCFSLSCCVSGDAAACIRPPQPARQVTCRCRDGTGSHGQRQQYSECASYGSHQVSIPAVKIVTRD